VDNHIDTGRDPSEIIAGRFVGMAVFLLGIGLLVLAFVMTYQTFHNPALLVPERYLSDPKAAVTSTVALLIGLKLILLFAMGYLASLIASRGAQLFFAARKEARRVSAGD
jgi:hypothetical protein